TAVAPGHPAATEDLASGQDHGLGPLAAAGFQSIGVRRWRRARRTTCGWSRSRVILRWPRKRPSKDDLASSSSDPISGVRRPCLSSIRRGRALAHWVEVRHDRYIFAADRNATGPSQEACLLFHAQTVRARTDTPQGPFGPNASVLRTVLRQGR